MYWRLYNSTYIGAQVRRQGLCRARQAGAWVPRKEGRMAGCCSQPASCRPCAKLLERPLLNADPPSPTHAHPPSPHPPATTQDAMVACYPRMEDDGINTYRRHELDVFI